MCNCKKKKRSFSFWVHCFFNNGAHGKKIHLVKLTMERIQCLCPSVGTQVILIVADQRGSCSWESGGIRSGVREVCGLCDGTVYMCVCVHIWELTPVHACLWMCAHTSLRVCTDMFTYRPVGHRMCLNEGDGPTQVSGRQELIHTYVYLPIAKYIAF